MILWLDLETTGLDERAGSILEIAMVLTDDDAAELGVFHALVKPFATANGVPLEGLKPMHEVVLAMHTKNGLLAELQAEGVQRRYEVEIAAVEFMRSTTKLKVWPDMPLAIDQTDWLQLLKKTPLGGNSVHFDRAWLREHMPELEALFSYRNVDMSSMNELAKRWHPDVWKGRPGANPETGEQDKSKIAHRALDDVRQSIETAKYYKSKLFER